jgi:DNA replication protein DnaC
MLAMLERTRLLIIDDWGPEPLTVEQRRDLLEIVEDRYEKGSLLMTSQIPVSDGTNSSSTQRSATPSWTVSFIALTASI